MSEYLDHREARRLHEAGIPPDTDLFWVCCYPSHPMHQPWTRGQVAAAGLDRPQFNLTPVYTVNAGRRTAC